MKRRLLALASCMMLAAAQPGEAQLRGRIMRAGTEETVAGAFVRLHGATARMVSSASNGAYAFDNLAPGDYCVLVDHPAFEPARSCVTLGASGSLVLDLPLVLRPVPLAPLLVMGERDAIVRQVGDSTARGPTIAQQEPRILSTRAGRALGSAIMGEIGREGREPTSGAQQHALYLWGTSTERGRVLLDGASLNAPLHLGTLLPPVDPEVLSSAALRTGGISPRYDGGAAYIVEYTTRPATSRAATWGEVDLLTGQVGAEAALGDGGRILASARRVNDETIEGLLSENFGYSYGDLFARADLRLGTGSGLHLTTFGTSENVRIPRDFGHDEAAWSNRAALLEWRSDHGENRRSALVSLSRGTADLPLLTAPGGHMKAGLQRASASARQVWSAGSGMLEAGAELEHLRFERRSRADQDPQSGLEGVACTRTLPCTDARATLASLFGELTIAPATNITAAVGMRATFDAEAGRFHVLPRASFTVLPAATYALTLSVGRFSQAQARSVNGVNASLNERTPLELSHATHVQLGMLHTSGNAFMNASAYVRNYEAFGSIDGRVVPGGDVTAGYTTGIGTFSMAYTISRATLVNNAADETGPQQLIALNFAGKHRALELDLTAAYGTGVPITSIVLEHPEDFTSAADALSTAGQTSRVARVTPDREHLRLDATLGAEFRIRRDDRVMRLVPYIRIVNALSQRDALFYFQEGNVSQPAQALARLPAVPTIGLRWQF